MYRYYFAVAFLIVVLSYMFFRCSSQREASKNDVEVTYYFNPGCPHCRNFMPVWKDFVSGGGANFVEINCSSNPERCAGVRGVPWVVFSKSGGTPAQFTGPRDKKSLDGFLKSM